MTYELPSLGQTLRSVSFLLASVALTLGVSTSSYAQVTATTGADVTPLLKNLSLNLQLRHYTDQELDANGNVSKISPKVQLRTILSNTFFNDALTLSLTGYFEKLPSNTQVSQLAPQVYGEVAALSGDNFAISPYVEAYLPHNGTASIIIPGSYQTVKTQIPLQIGAISLSAGLDLSATLSSATQDVAYEVEGSLTPELASVGGLNLVSKQDGTLEARGTKEDPDYAYEFDFALGWTNQKFKAEVRQFVLNEYSTNYSLSAAGAKKKASTQALSTYERLRLSYAVTDALSVINDTYVYQDGFYEALPTGRQVLNIAYMSYKL